MFSYYFTLEEANKTLEDLAEEMHVLQELQLKYRELLAVRLHCKQEGFDGSNTKEEKLFMLEARIDFWEFQSRQLIKQLESKSIFVKSIDQGLVDFPAKIDGSPVLLCWKQGESEILHYHGVFETYKKRKKVNYIDE